MLESKHEMKLICPYQLAVAVRVCFMKSWHSNTCGCQAIQIFAYVHKHQLIDLYYTFLLSSLQAVLSSMLCLPSIDSFIYPTTYLSFFHSFRSSYFHSFCVSLITSIFPSFFLSSFTSFLISFLPFSFLHSFFFPSFLLSFLLSFFFLSFSFLPFHVLSSFFTSFLHSCLSSYLSSPYFFPPYLPSFFPPVFPSFFLVTSISPFHPQYNQISYIHSCTYFHIPIFVRLIFILPSFSQYILTYIITFSVHSPSSTLKTF